MEDALSFPWTEALKQEGDLELRWQGLSAWLQERFGKEPDLDGILFLIGVQETGCGYKPELDKRSKERLVVEGTYCAFETLGFYRRIGMEADGHWIWESLEPLPTDLSAREQETVLRLAVISYFHEHMHVDSDES